MSRRYDDLSGPLYFFHIGDVFQRRSVLFWWGVRQTISPIINRDIAGKIDWPDHLQLHFSDASLYLATIAVLFRATACISRIFIRPASVIIIRCLQGLTYILATFPVDVLWTIVSATSASWAILGIRFLMKTSGSTFTIGCVTSRIRRLPQWWKHRAPAAVRGKKYFIIGEYHHAFHDTTHDGFRTLSHIGDAFRYCI